MSRLIVTAKFGRTAPAAGILTVSGLLGTFFESSGFHIAAVVTSLAGTTGLFVFLVASQNGAPRSHHQDSNPLSRYCDIMMEQLNQAWGILFWEQIDVVKSNGDTTETLTIYARVDSRELYFFRLRFGSLGEPLTDRLRRRVTVKVRNVLIDGIGGTRFDTTTHWLADGRIEVLAHLNTPAQQGSEVRFSLEVYWPGKCAVLVKHREPDIFRIHFSKIIEFARYAVVLPEGEDAFYDPIGFTHGENGYRISSGLNSSDQVEVSFVAHNVPANRPIGMRLDLKDGHSDRTKLK